MLDRRSFQQRARSHGSCVEGVEYMASTFALEIATTNRFRDKESFTFFESDAATGWFMVVRPFGNEQAPDAENPTYGTNRVMLALQVLKTNGMDVSDALNKANKAEKWLVEAQNKDGSWGGFRGGDSSTEETALASEALAGQLSESNEEREGVRCAVETGVDWLIKQMDSGKWKEPAPIGLYFAKLWYFEKLYPIIFTVAALERLSLSLKR